MPRVACEVSTTTGLILVMGEITTSTYVDIPALVRDVVRDIGYTRAKFGFDADTCGVIVVDQGAEPGHRARRRQGAGGEAGRDDRRADRGHRRRRPGHDDRLRLQRDRRVHAADHRPGAQALQAAGARAQGRHAALPAARRQEPGHGGVPRRQAGARGHHRRLHAAQRPTWSTPRSRPTSTSA